ncbi:MAG: DUF366 family protein [Deltaproteobacteria bacterium]|nr:DUF366 family protein [Deltaproteobacteria bacterium]
METLWIPESLPYDGSQLRSHWIFDRTGRAGDAICAFTGPARVEAAHMVDREDARAKAWIRSDAMLHFLVEHFGVGLYCGILRQRLLIAICGEELRIAHPETVIVRRGNDLHEGMAKLSVAIATVSPVSCLLHAGINIASTNTPVCTKGLEDYGIAPAPFATKVMERYAAEMAGVLHARAKVRAVP